MGWILFGYDLGVLGGVLNQPDFVAQFGLSNDWQALMSSVFELFAMVGALIMVAFGHVLGRKDNVAIGTGIISVGAVIQASAFGIPQLLIGRIIGGIGLGIFSAQVPTWQAETARKEIRGRLIGSYLSFLCVGLVLSYFLDYGMAKAYSGSVSWRFPFAFQGVLAGLNIILTRFNHESPRYYLLKSRRNEARATLAAMRDVDDDHPEIIAELEQIQAAIDLEHEHQKGWKDLLKADDHVRSRRRMLTACAIQALQPFSGSTVISFYVQSIFQDSIGMDQELASLMSGFVQVWFLIASIGTWWLIEVSITFHLVAFYEIASADVSACRTSTHVYGFGLPHDCHVCRPRRHDQDRHQSLQHCRRDLHFSVRVLLHLGLDGGRLDVQHRDPNIAIPHVWEWTRCRVTVAVQLCHGVRRQGRFRHDRVEDVPHLCHLQLFVHTFCILCGTRGRPFTRCPLGLSS